MSITIYNDNISSFISLTKARLYYNEQWYTLKAADKLYYSGQWYYLGNIIQHYTNFDFQLIAQYETPVSNLILSSGELYVYQGQQIRATEVKNSGTYIFVSGGTAINTIVGFYGFKYRDDSPWDEVIGRYTQLPPGQSNTIFNGGTIQICSNGTAIGTTLRGGHQAEINGAAFYRKSFLNIKKDGNAVSTNINSGGIMQVYGGGVADQVHVNSDGYLYIYSGGSATNIHWTPDTGNIYLKDAACAEFDLQTQERLKGVWTLQGHTMQYSSGYINGNNSNYALDSAYVFSSGILQNAGYEFINVWSGGVASNISAYKIQIFGGGTVDSASVYKGLAGVGGGLSVSSGGTATNIIISSGAMLKLAVAPDTYIQGTSSGSAFEIINGNISGYTGAKRCTLTIYSGGTADTIILNSDCQLSVESGGIANHTTLTATCSMHISNGGVANNTIVNAYAMRVSSGGTANSTVINSLGKLYIYSSGFVNETTINSGGSLCVSSGGILNSAVVFQGGTILLFSGASYYAGTIINSGGSVEGLNGAISLTI